MVQLQHGAHQKGFSHDPGSTRDPTVTILSQPPKPPSPEAVVGHVFEIDISCSVMLCPSKRTHRAENDPWGEAEVTSRRSEESLQCLWNLFGFKGTKRKSEG